MHPEPALRAALATVAVIPLAGSFHRVTDLRYRLDALRAARRLGALTPSALASSVDGSMGKGGSKYCTWAVTP
jgi:hypothetical protein